MLNVILLQLHVTGSKSNQLQLRVTMEQTLCAKSNKIISVTFAKKRLLFVEM